MHSSVRRNLLRWHGSSVEKKQKKFLRPQPHPCACFRLFKRKGTRGLLNIFSSPTQTRHILYIYIYIVCTLAHLLLGVFNIFSHFPMKKIITSNSVNQLMDAPPKRGNLLNLTSDPEQQNKKGASYISQSTKIVGGKSICFLHEQKYNCVFAESS